MSLDGLMKSDGILLFVVVFVLCAFEDAAKNDTMYVLAHIYRKVVLTSV